jgi:hypothetical protein
MLFMKSVSLSNLELGIIADSLINYPFLHTLDVSENRLEGKSAGESLALIIRRKPNLVGGIQISRIFASNNLIGSKGFQEICQALGE